VSNSILKAVDATTVRGWLNENRAVLIDIREADEHALEHIAEARLMPLSGFDSIDYSHEHDKIAVFHCKMGGRTSSAAQQILNIGLGEVYQLEGGIQAWKAAGFPCGRTSGHYGENP